MKKVNLVWVLMTVLLTVIALSGSRASLHAAGPINATSSNTAEFADLERRVASLEGRVASLEAHNAAQRGNKNDDR